MAKSYILETRSLSRIVNDTIIVDKFTYAFTSGNIHIIIGPSGAGKSSLLRLLNRLDEPTSGEVLFHGKPTTEYSPCQLRCKIGYLFQTPHMFPGTVRDNLLYARNTLQEDDVNRLLEQVQIAPELVDMDVDTLSVGQKQRVALGRLLATEPEIVLLDEPTSALDPTYTEAIELTIKDIVNHTNLTVLMVTHNPEQALRMGGEGLLLVNGKLIESGPCEQIINNPATELGKMYRERKLK